MFSCGVEGVWTWVSEGCVLVGGWGDVMGIGGERYIEYG